MNGSRRWSWASNTFAEFAEAASANLKELVAQNSVQVMQPIACTILLLDSYAIPQTFAQKYIENNKISNDIFTKNTLFAL